MSARVFNPFNLNEMRRLREASRFMPDAETRARVCRDLFGPVNHEETRAFVAKELKTSLDRDCDRWSFDFLRGKPRANERFLWVRVGTVPAAYALRRMPFLGGDCAPRNLANPLSTASATVPAEPTPARQPSLETGKTTVPAVGTPTLSKAADSRTPSPAPAPAPAKAVKRQAAMTDYLQVRKRSAPSSKTVQEHPAKRARTATATSS